MIFNSIGFAVFLPIIFILYWICPAKYRYLFLLAASFYFYMQTDRRDIFPPPPFPIFSPWPFNQRIPCRETENVKKEKYAC